MTGTGIPPLLKIGGLWVRLPLPAPFLVSNTVMKLLLLALLCGLAGAQDDGVLYREKSKKEPEAKYHVWRVRGHVVTSDCIGCDEIPDQLTECLTLKEAKMIKHKAEELQKQAKIVFSVSKYTIEKCSK